MGIGAGPTSPRTPQLDQVRLAVQALQDDGVFLGLQAELAGRFGHGLGGRLLYTSYAADEPQGVIFFGN